MNPNSLSTTKNVNTIATQIIVAPSIGLVDSDENPMYAISAEIATNTVFLTWYHRMLGFRVFISRAFFEALWTEILLAFRNDRIANVEPNRKSDAGTEQASRAFYS